MTQKIKWTGYYKTSIHNIDMVKRDKFVVFVCFFFMHCMFVRTFVHSKQYFCLSFIPIYGCLTKNREYHWPVFEMSWWDDIHRKNNVIIPRQRLIIMKQSTIMQILFTGDDVVVACFQHFLTKKGTKKGTCMQNAFILLLSSNPILIPQYLLIDVRCRCTRRKDFWLYSWFISSNLNSL